jgi:glutathione S-transferase
LGLDFPNLPYLIDGDFKLTETSAISFYIIERSKKGEQLLGKNLKERAMIMSVCSIIKDLYESINRLIYDPQSNTKKEEVYKEIVSDKMKYLSTFRGKKEWLFDRLTLPDFMLAELSYYIESVFPNEYKNLSFLG